MQWHLSKICSGLTMMVLVHAMVGCGPVLVGDVGEDGMALKGEVELPEGMDETFIEGFVATKIQAGSNDSCLGSNTDGWCNPGGTTGCRGGKLFSCAMGQRCAAKRYVDRDGSFAGCSWANEAQANPAATTHCSPLVGGYCKTQRSGVRCDSNKQKTFYCAGAGNSCETRTCGRITLTGCSQNHPCEGIRVPFAACQAGDRKPCWWYGYKGHQTCENGQWSWMCHAKEPDPAPNPNQPSVTCHPGQTRICYWNGFEGHQTCDGNTWSFLCHTNGPQGNPDPTPQCQPGNEKPCTWNGYSGHNVCLNGKWSSLCHTNNFGGACHPGQQQPCFWNGRDGHQNCDGNVWSWTCHINSAPNECNPGQTRHCEWKGHPGHQKCFGNKWSFLCYTQ